MKHILEKILNENADADKVTVDWIKTDVARAIPGLDINVYGDAHLKGSKDPISGKPLRVFYYSTMGKRIILNVPNLNLGTTGSHFDEAELKVETERLSDQNYQKEIIQKLKVHFVKWSKFYDKFQALYKDLNDFRKV